MLKYIFKFVGTVNSNDKLRLILLTACNILCTQAVVWFAWIWLFTALLFKMSAQLTVIMLGVIFVAVKIATTAILVRHWRLWLVTLPLQWLAAWLASCGLFVATHSDGISPHETGICAGLTLGWILLQIPGVLIRRRLRRREGEAKE